MPTEVSMIRIEEKSQQKTVVKEVFLSICINAFSLISIKSDMADARLLRVWHAKQGKGAFHIEFSVESFYFAEKLFVSRPQL